MSGFLSAIALEKREEVRLARAARGLADLEAGLCKAPPVRDFLGAIGQTLHGGRAALICEIKKASPGAGIIRADIDIVERALAYQSGGATCLSVLTDRLHFGAGPNDLPSVRRAVSLPLLRKDFLIDPWQVAQSRAMGADCVLLILGMLDDSLATELALAAQEYGMDMIAEIHDEPELERAFRLFGCLSGGMAIGVNSRDLRTMKVDLGVIERLVPRIPDAFVTIAESGVRVRADIERLAACGAQAFLVGEALMRASDPVHAVAEMVGGPGDTMQGKRQNSG